EAAAGTDTVVILNLYERDGDKTFDSSPVIDSDGSLLGVTRMTHITDYDCFFERGYYHPGDNLAPVFQTSAGRIGVAICYDRHYPEYMRSLALQGAELVVIPQAGVSDEWPDGMYEGEIRVASFQNGYFCAMANRVGRENRLNFSGGSVVSDPWGRIVAQAPFNEEAILYADVDLEICATSPARKLFLRDRRPEIYEGGAVRLT
ncbi:MAG: carbon-nitrogen hydrolase family protein, partial [Rhodothermia bacterium]